MSEVSAPSELQIIRVECGQRIYPPYDRFHATPSALLWRQVKIETPQGSAVFEQTDYGHPGRLNAWEPRGIANALLPRLGQLKSVVEALGALLSG